MASDQPDVLDAWHWSQYRHGIARERAQTDAEVTNLGRG
jgi:hypothetical protein